ncbi:MAG: hypothetical protein IJ106_08310 [Parasporobacterium sp.]|nr:hypothetical protein [Parasporobacterium sp.]
MAITVNLYYTGTNGNARKFAEEMESSGTAEAIDIHHASLMMGTIAAFREKYDLHMTVARFANADIPESEGRFVRK